MINSRFTFIALVGARRWLKPLAVGALVTSLVACSSGIIPNYNYYSEMTTDEIATNFKHYSKDDGSLWLTAPWMVELVGWLNEREIVDNQAQKLIAEYSPKSKELNLHAQLEYAYTIAANKNFEPAEFDRVRINEGRLLLIDSMPADKDCNQDECTYSQKIIVPLSVAEVVGSRYTGMVLQIIDPGKPVMTFRLPETYVRSFSDQAGELLAQNHMDFDRVVDVNARLENEFGRDQLTVEDMAREWQCDRTTVQAIEMEGPNSLFQVECGKDSYRLVRCQWGECVAEGTTEQ